MNVIKAIAIPTDGNMFGYTIGNRTIQSVRYGYMLYSQHPQIGQRGEGGYDLKMEVFADHLHIWDSEGRMGYVTVPFTSMLDAKLLEDHTTIRITCKHRLVLQFA